MLFVLLVDVIWAEVKCRDRLRLAEAKVRGLSGSGESGPHGMAAPATLSCSGIVRLVPLLTCSMCKAGAWVLLSTPQARSIYIYISFIVRSAPGGLKIQLAPPEI